MNIIFRTIRESFYHFCKGVYLLPGKAEAFFVPEDAEKLFPQGWTVLKNSRSVLSFQDHEHSCFVKIYKKNGLWRTLKRYLALCPRSRRCFAGALHLKKLGIPTPEVWAASRFFLVTDLVPEGARFLNHFPVKAELLVDLAATLHRSNMIHGDLNYRNIYCLPDGRFGLIDLDGAKLYERSIPRRVRERELARLLSSAFMFNRIESPAEILQKTEEFCMNYEKAASLSCDHQVVFKLQKAYRIHVYRKKEK